MTPEARVITDFYQAFARRDAEAMAACYDDDVVFTDPVFGELRGERARDMWRMLCERGQDLRVTFKDVVANENQGSAHWEARYTFSATGRAVTNVIDARFELRDGKIIRHRDKFDLYRWACQALGPRGILLGWMPPIQRAIGNKAKRGLDAYVRAKNDDKSDGDATHPANDPLTGEPTPARH
jgi:ketosteroid isomerase-like protein